FCWRESRFSRSRRLTAFCVRSRTRAKKTAESPSSAGIRVSIFLATLNGYGSCPMGEPRVLRYIPSFKDHGSLDGKKECFGVELASFRPHQRRIEGITSRPGAATNRTGRSAARSSRSSCRTKEDFILITYLKGHTRVRFGSQISESAKDLLVDLLPRISTRTVHVPPPDPPPSTSGHRSRGSTLTGPLSLIRSQQCERRPTVALTSSLHDVCPATRRTNRLHGPSSSIKLARH